ncbi:MAG: hypothetical protein JWO05_2466 [Gemmatimonadetes bacterium]|nr:hypothetical protein [Gemmatimonadota bacterium]
MPYDISRFELADMLRCGGEMRRGMLGAPTVEDAARRACRILYDGFRNTADDSRQCALVRFYCTQPYSRLPRDLKAFASRSFEQGSNIASSMKCLTLIGTAGDEEAWNDRRSSQGHQAIPLPTPQLVEQAPMIAQLVRQFGLDLADLVQPNEGTIVGERFDRTYGIFHVEEALGSPYIPAQKEFVVPHGIRSVIGFGGSLRTGDLFAVILFSRVSVPRANADRFRNVALDVKSALFLLDQEQVFEGSPSHQ